jgi:FkbH-like protein
VQSAHPGIRTLRFPQGNDQQAYALLEQLRTLFGKSRVSDEDALRLESLRSAYRRTADNSGGESNPEDFLKQSEAVVTVSFRKDPPDPRALELVNKTNQFNLNGKRYTEGQWQTYLNQPETELMVVSYEDKYGALGKIAVLSGRRDGARFVVDSWVMSCRAFSRRIEFQCLQALFGTFGLEEIRFDYAATERNGPLQDFMKEILGDLPEGNGSLTQEVFRRNCPPLYFKE